MITIHQISTSSVLLVLALVASGCATLDRGQCETGDWQSHGYTDGAAGHGSEFLGLHQRACAKHGIDIGLSEYQKGYRLGLVDFCIPSTGRSLGLQEGEYHYVCPSELEADFLLAYGSGLRTALGALHRQSYELEGRLWHARVHRRVESIATSEDGKADLARLEVRRSQFVSSVESKLDYLHDRELNVRHLMSRAARHLVQLQQESSTD